VALHAVVLKVCGLRKCSGVDGCGSAEPQRVKTMTVPQPRSGPHEPLDAGVFQPGIGSFRLHLVGRGQGRRDVRTCTRALHPVVRPASRRAAGSGSPGPGTGSRDKLPGSTPAAEPGIRRCAPRRSHSGGGTGRSTASGPALDHRRGMQQGPVAAPAARPSRTSGRACARGWLRPGVAGPGRDRCRSPRPGRGDPRAAARGCGLAPARRSLETRLG